MAESATRYLYLTRHGEAAPDGSGLTADGRRQAVLLGRRLADRPIAAVHHGPLPRAAQSARLIAEQLGGGRPGNEPLGGGPLGGGWQAGAVPTVCEEAGDYVPYVPERHELPADSADYLLDFLAQSTAEERARGPELARRAVQRFTGPVAGGEDRHELVVTHAFLIGWLVRHALSAPAWRWLGLNSCNAALTVIRYTPGRPSYVLLHNDMRHLPDELCWTGFPSEARC
ncbi:histidine phosphatase family protein [Kitasatospora sp. NPDC087271]|uniref:histidine phosphatase family protein n=1 Tax=Kitasatospora sp. NPDC087271 TaxID=3364067 RepID=UPI003801FF38